MKKKGGRINDEIKGNGKKLISKSNQREQSWKYRKGERYELQVQRVIGDATTKLATALYSVTTRQSDRIRVREYKAHRGHD